MNDAHRHQQEAQRQAELHHLKSRLAMLEAPEPAPYQGRARGTSAALVAAGFILLLIVVGVGIVLSTGSGLQLGKGASAEDASGSAGAWRSTWAYENTTDKATGRLTRLACIISAKDVHLEGPSRMVNAQLCFRRTPPSGLRAYVALNGGGQIRCPVPGGCTLRVRFDDAPVGGFGARASSEPSTVVFLTNPGRFLNGVRRSKATFMAIETPSSGGQALEFNTEGLRWAATPAAAPAPAARRAPPAQAPTGGSAVIDGPTDWLVPAPPEPPLM